MKLLILFACLCLMNSLGYGQDLEISEYPQLPLLPESKNSWHLPNEVFPSDVQFINETYRVKGVKTLHLNYRDGTPFKTIHFNKEGFKICQIEYLGSNAVRNEYHIVYESAQNQINVSITCLRYVSDTLYSSEKYEQRYTDSLTEFISESSIRNIYVAYDLAGNKGEIIDRRTREQISNRDPFAHKNTHGNNVHSKKIYKRGKLKEERVEEYNWYIASTPEISNSRTYKIKYHYNRNGLVKRVTMSGNKIYELEYAYYD